VDAAPSGDRRLVARAGAAGAAAHLCRLHRGARAGSAAGAGVPRLSDLVAAAGSRGGRGVLAAESGRVLHPHLPRGARGACGGVGRAAWS